MSGLAAPTQQLAALADDTRWAILELLGSRARSASELAEELPVSRQAIAKHLAVLEAAGLVESTREGRSVRHRAIGATLSALADRLDAIGRQWESRLDRVARMAEARAASDRDRDRG
ncbi:metalloregulator ArsR/SmtB family transcription factor [Agrococcus sp. Marseille-Q4369]|uniref:ArsR/SmtB family transcription factor n=1 Tax=Agrococcus sp. Marseille-Q4369 TaxID=2810513 RepID=UPI001B8C0227|nr:metalloregulator ArsR/SmtB family transcription factor [Agrococcus sp. Marseille-Q4369]QUW19050.1 winged helix-turn-helix transcriptional regulator [Agrococcus sp. Marseille-Q4369]